MLQNIHKLFTGWIAWFVASIIALTFILWGVDTFLSGHAFRDQGQTVAKVNGEKITQTQFMQVYDQLRAQQIQELGEGAILTPAIDSQLRAQALEQLTTMLILQKDAQKNGFVVSQGQAQQALMQIPQFQSDGAFSVDLFQQTIAQSRYTPDTFIQELQNGLLVNQFRAGIIASAFVLPAELDMDIKLLSQQRDYRYLLVPTGKFSDEIKPTEKQLSDYYQQNQALFRTPETVSIDYLELSLTDLIEKQNLTEQQAKDFYQANIDNYTIPAKWQVAHILVSLPDNSSQAQLDEADKKVEKIQSELAKGTPFAELAQQYSDDVLSAPSGGELSWFSQGTFEPQFESAVQTLQQKGDVSQPVMTAYGYEIIQLLDIQPAEQIPFDDVKQNISDMLARENAQAQFAQMADQLADITFINPETLQTAADELDLPIQSTDVFTRAGAEQGILSNQSIIQAAFSQAVLTDRENSDLIQFDPQTVVVLRVDQHQPDELIPFSQVQGQIEQQLIDSGAQQKAQEIGQQLLSELQKNGQISADELAQYDLSWSGDQTARFNALSEDDDPALMQTLFELPRPQGDDEHSSEGVTLSSGSYAIVQLQQITDGDAKQLSNGQQQGIRNQIENTDGLFDYELYVQGLMNNAQVTPSNVVADNPELPIQ